MLPTDTFVHKEDVIVQSTGADAVLFDMVSGHYYSLNELGARVWDLCDGVRSLYQIADMLEIEYDAPRSLIVADLEEMASELVESGLLLRA